MHWRQSPPSVVPLRESRREADANSACRRMSKAQLARTFLPRLALQIRLYLCRHGEQPRISDAEASSNRHSGKGGCCNHSVQYCCKLLRQRRHVSCRVCLGGCHTRKSGSCRLWSSCQEVRLSEQLSIQCQQYVRTVWISRRLEQPRKPQCCQ